MNTHSYHSQAKMFFLKLVLIAAQSAIQSVEGFGSIDPSEG